MHEHKREFGWGIVGSGDIASKFAEDLDHIAGAVKRSVSARDQEKAARFAAEHGMSAGAVSLDQLLDDEAIDIVYIATPHVAHCELALKAIAAGKAVLIEKPITMTSEEARAIASAAREKNVFAMEALWSRFLPAVQRGKALIENGALGRITHAEASLHFHRPFDATHRLFDPALGGGVLHDLGVYPLSVVCFLLGRPTLVESSTEKAATGVEQRARFVLDCQGVQVNGSVGFEPTFEAEGENTIVIYGEKATLRIDRHFLRTDSMTVFDRPIEKLASSKGWRERIFKRLPLDGRKTERFARQSHGLNYQAAAVQAAIARGEIEHATMPLDESAHVLDLIDEISKT